MRISTSQIFDAGALNIQRNQADVFKTYNQISTGRRVLTPADDPVAAAQALIVSQSGAVNAGHIENQGAAADKLKLLESKLTSATESMQNLLEKAVQAGNSGTLSDADRKSISTDMRQQLAQLLATANSQDGSGLYMFSGYQTNVLPFTAASDPVNSSAPATLTPPQNFANPYVTYHGDQGRAELQVDASRVMPVGENGSDVFMRVVDKDGNLTGGSVFDAIKNMIDTLEMPIATNPTFQTDFNKSLGDMQAILDNTVRIRSSVGSRLAELDSLGATSSSLTLQFEETLSNLQDLDYAKALTDFTKQQTNLEAAQKSFAQISSLSLFKIL
jgi:flagellar hook-associated protein 3 FlgL